MQMYQPWLRDIQAWAKLHGSVREVWLFGSRARGVAKPESDVDLALVLMPPARLSSTPGRSYLAAADKWQHDLKADCWATRKPHTSERSVEARCLSSTTP